MDHIHSTEQNQLIAADEPLYTISSVVKLVGISEHTIRMYEREGLIVTFKKSSGHRLFSKNDIDRIKCVRDMISNRKMSIAGIKGMISLIPCWKIINCSKEDQENCGAYQEDFWPCWTYKHSNNICSGSDCRLCEVYTVHGRCTEIKKLIRKITFE